MLVKWAYTGKAIWMAQGQRVDISNLVVSDVQLWL